MECKISALDLAIAYLAMNSSQGNPDHWGKVEALNDRVLMLDDEEQSLSGINYEGESTVWFDNADLRDEPSVILAFDRADAVKVVRIVTTTDIDLILRHVRKGIFAKLLGTKARRTIERLTALRGEIGAEEAFSSLPQKTREDLLQRKAEEI